MQKAVVFLLCFLCLNTVKSNLFARKVAFNIEYSSGVDDDLFGARWFYYGERFGVYAAVKMNWTFSGGDDFYDDISPQKAENDYGDEYIGSDFVQSEVSVGLAYNLSGLAALSAFKHLVCINVLAGLTIYSNRELRNYRDSTHILADDGTYVIEGYVDETTYGIELGVHLIFLESLSVHMLYSTAIKNLSYGAGFAFAF